MTKNGEVALIRRGSDALARRMEPLEGFMTPAVDIFETSEAFVLKIDMPGVQKESISIQVEPGILQVKGLIAQLYKETTNLVFSEIRKASFYRRFNIGSGIDVDNILANFENGVLTVTLHKHESIRAREIPIK
jgi:HSP20 family protein